MLQKSTNFAPEHEPQEGVVKSAGHGDPHFEKIVIRNGQWVVTNGMVQKCVGNSMIRQDMSEDWYWKVVWACFQYTYLVLNEL